MNVTSFYKKFIKRKEFTVMDSMLLRVIMKSRHKGLWDIPIPEDRFEAALIVMAASFTTREYLFKKDPCAVADFIEKLPVDLRVLFLSRLDLRTLERMMQDPIFDHMVRSIMKVAV